MYTNESKKLKMKITEKKYGDITKMHRKTPFHQNIQLNSSKND